MLIGNGCGANGNDRTMRVVMAFIVHVNGRSMKAVLCKSPDSHGVAFHGWQAEVKLHRQGKRFLRQRLLEKG